MEAWLVQHTDVVKRIRDEDWEIFHQVCPYRPFRKGDTIYYAGDPASSMHIVAQGQIKLVNMTAGGQERIVAICGKQDFIGEAFLSENAVYRADAIALTEGATCPISRPQFLELAKQAPRFVLSIAEVLAGQLFECREQLTDAYAPVKARVVKVLLSQALRFGQPLEHSLQQARSESSTQDTSAWYSLDTALKHEEVAAMVTATRVSVSMAIAELRDEGLLEGSRGKYRLELNGLEALLERN